MSRFIPISLKGDGRRWLRIALLILIPILLLVAYLAYVFFVSGRSSGRWAYFTALRLSPETFEQYKMEPGMMCGDAPFAFPTSGAVIGLWDQSYRIGHHHAGLDIFPLTEPGVTPIYAAYDGFLTRQDDWVSTVIIRIPNDPLLPARQIWTYYTHMADEDGSSFISEEFPPGTEEVFVEAGTFLGYQGNYSGEPGNPTGLHLHFSIVRDDGQGGFLNELEIANTYDPSPYFNLALNHNDNPDTIPTCAAEELHYADWAADLDERQPQ